MLDRRLEDCVWRCHFIAHAPSRKHHASAVFAVPLSSRAYFFDQKRMRLTNSIKTGSRGALMIQVRLTNRVRLKARSTVCLLLVLTRNLQQ